MHKNINHNGEVSWHQYSTVMRRALVCVCVCVCVCVHEVCGCVFSPLLPSLTPGPARLTHTLNWHTSRRTGKLRMNRQWQSDWGKV